MNSVSVPPIHAQLQQQLREALGLTSEALAALLNPADSEETAAEAVSPQGLSRLILAVNAHYQQFERAQQLRLQSLGASAAELNAAQRE